MNKFYDAANIISVFFVMPIIIFMAIHLRDKQAVRSEVPVQEERISQQAPDMKPDLQVRPDAAQPDLKPDVKPDAKKPEIKPDANPAPEINPQPGKRPGAAPNRPGMLRRPSGGCPTCPGGGMFRN